MNQTLAAFVAAHARLERRAFLAAVPDPHLLIPPAEQACGRGSNVSTVKVREPAARVDGGPPPQLLVVPVRRRDGADRVPGAVTIGRAPTSDVVVPHPSVSRLQAYLCRSQGRWWVGDPCSSNGTTVDGHRAPAEGTIPLRSGARLVLAGALEVVFLEPPDLFALVQDQAAAAAAGMARARSA